jgi:hypothetical protein
VTSSSRSSDSGGSLASDSSPPIANISLKRSLASSCGLVFPRHSRRSDAAEDLNRAIFAEPPGQDRSRPARGRRGRWGSGRARAETDIVSSSLRAVRTRASPEISGRIGGRTRHGPGPSPAGAVRIDRAGPLRIRPPRPPASPGRPGQRRMAAGRLVPLRARPRRQLVVEPRRPTGLSGSARSSRAGRDDRQRPVIHSIRRIPDNLWMRDLRSIHSIGLPGIN